METKKISVIVPVYNVEDYIYKCINSILENKYSLLEVILVDDGSTDNSGAICDHFASRDSRVSVIHKKNGGLSSARNAGIEQATGDYISFIDSDDFIDRNMFTIMVEKIEKNDADIIQCGVYQINENDVISTRYQTGDWISQGDQILEDFFVNQKIPVMVWNKLFRKEVIRDIRFPEGKNNEDNIFMVDILPNVRKMLSISKQMYYYLMRSNSITGASFNPKKFDSIYAYKYMIKQIDEKYKKYIPYINYWRCKNSIYLWNLINSSSLSNNEKNTYYKVVEEEFEQSYPFFLSIRNQIPMSDQLFIMMFRINKLITVKLYRLYNRRNK